MTVFKIYERGLFGTFIYCTGLCMYSLLYFPKKFKSKNKLLDILDDFTYSVATISTISILWPISLPILSDRIKSSNYWSLWLILILLPINIQKISNR